MAWLERPAPTNPRDPSKLWLDRNENTDPLWQSVVAGCVAALPPSVWWSYPDLAPLYDKLAAHLGVDVDRLVLGQGSDGCIQSIFQAFVGPGDVVLRTEPTFGMYSVYSRMFGAQEVVLNYVDGPTLTAERVIDAIRSTRPVLVCLPNPEGSTGTVREDFTRILDTAASTGAYVLVDEAYYPFYLRAEMQTHPRAITTRSAGKAWGIAGARLGYTIAVPFVAHALRRMRPMCEVSGPAAALFSALLDRTDDMLASVQRIIRGKTWFAEHIQAFGYRTHVGHGNFVHVNFGERAERVHELIGPLAYYRRESDHPSLAGFCRFTAAPVDTLIPLVDAIARAS